MFRVAALAYGVVCYLIFLATFLYGVGFVGNLLVPKSIDSGAPVPAAAASIVDVLLLGLFAVPHSVMARRRFKDWWVRFVPRAMERSTYVLVSSLLLALLYRQWRPLPTVVWEVTNPAGRVVLHTLFWAGWGVALLSTFLIDHFDLFGLRQVYLYVRREPYRPVGFKVVAFYRFVRHPLMLGFLVAFWAAPRMTAGHLLFAAATTAYILVAIQLEERDLVAHHGEVYREYQRQVGMLLPRGVFRPGRPAGSDKHGL
jgi:protein-S-isoprenylcysteine O-methyltransferase Ste14